MRIGKIRLAAILSTLGASPAFAGPPYFTDDPAPTDTGHWEIYAFGAGTKTAGNFDGVTGLDLNYGPVEDVQLTATLPVEFAHGGGTRQAGIGDIEVGVKYRFLHDEASGVAVAIFPRVILPTAVRGFGSGKVGVLLPIWAQKDAGPWSIFGGGGYTINPGAGSRDYWLTSAALTRTVSKRLSLGAEVFHRSADEIGGRSYTALNFGGSYRLGGPFALLVSGGPGIAHAREGGQYNLYTAIALNF
jgi:hypothetical protein